MAVVTEDGGLIKISMWNLSEYFGLVHPALCSLLVYSTAILFMLQNGSEIYNMSETDLE